MTLHVIDAQDDGLRLEQWCKRHLPGVPYGLTQKLIRKGAIRVQGAKIGAKDAITTGQTVYVSDQVNIRPDAPKRTSLPDTTQLEALRRMVIQEDARCFVVNKPAGLAVQGGSGLRDSVDARLEALQTPGAQRPRLVHRLDKDTSGILLIGKSREDAAFLTKAFRDKATRKLYWALVVGTPKEPVGTIELPLGKRYHDGKEKMSVVVDDNDGQQALTHYRVVETSGKLSWVELCPITGRTHQLRVHMAAIGHPIYGDGKYGGRQAFIDHDALSRQLHLHARHLALDEAGYRLRVTAPMPEHMRQAWDALNLPSEDQGVSLLELL